MQWLGALEGHVLGLVTPEPAGISLEEDLRRKTGAEAFTYRSGGAPATLGALGALVSGRPAQEGLFHTHSARQALGNALSSGPWDVAIVQMVRCFWAMEEIERRRPDLPVLFDAIDAMGLHFGRAAETARAPIGPLMRLEGRRCGALEMAMARRADLTAAVAPRDLEALAPPDGKGRVVPVAAAPRPATALGPAQTVLLSGNLGYRPTVEGARWFAREVWPRVLEQRPAARWVLAGARPPASVRRLADLPGVEVHPDVPDLTPYLAAARVAVAPMSSGSGVPMKVLEAWSSGIPVVAHPWAAAGLMGGEGSVVVARDATGWVEALDTLLGDVEEAERLGGRGLEAWRRHYRPEAVKAAILEAVKGTFNASSPA